VIALVGSPVTQTAEDGLSSARTKGMGMRKSRVTESQSHAVMRDGPAGHTPPRNSDCPNPHSVLVRYGFP